MDRITAGAQRDHTW